MEDEDTTPEPEPITEMMVTDEPLTETAPSEPLDINVQDLFDDEEVAENG